MRLVRVLIIGFTVLIVATFGSGAYWLWHHITVDVTFGKRFASIVDLPGGSDPTAEFQQKEGIGHFYPWGSHLEFRGDPRTPNYLLVRVFQIVGLYEGKLPKDQPATYYSQDALSLDCADQMRVQRASETDWKAARVLDRTDDTREPRAWRETLPPRQVGLEMGDHFYSYQGKRFRYTGDRAGGFVPSPNLVRVAVWSFNGTGGSWGGNLPDYYTYCIEIYDVVSGRHLATAQGYAHLVAVSSLFQEDASWITDRYFSFVLSSARDKFLLFDFDRKGESHDWFHWWS
jgi:hypothetical protein